MRGRDKKTTFFNFLPYECEAAEEYLETMAEEGWLLQSVNGAFLRFKKVKPQKLKYSVDVFNKISEFDHKDSDVALEYREYCQAAGWNYVCQKGKVQIFYSEDYKNTISIHTDGEEKFKSVFKASLYNIGGQLVLTLLFIFNLYMQLFMGSTEFTLATNLGILSVLTAASVVIINSIEIISFFLWVIKVRLHLKENEIMPYNNYKKIRIKNIFKSVYALIILLILLKFLIFDNHSSKTSNISLLLIMLIPSLILLLARKLINKKRYSKNTNLVLTIASVVVSVYLVMMFVGVTVFRSITEIEQSEVSTEKASLTFMDFGHKDNYDTSPYIRFDKSILANRINYSFSSEGNDLTYTIFQSQYPWLIDFDENRLVNRLNKYGIDLKQINTKLPNNIKVYSDSKKKNFVLVSEDKVVDIRKGFNNIDEDKFLSIVYNKLFVN